MHDPLDLTSVAHLIGDRARLKMLVALLAYGELSAGDLAAVAGVSTQTASAHLSKLQQGGLIRRAYGAYGARHKVFRLMDEDVARAVAALSVLAPAEPEMPYPAGRHEATLCYGHLGGTLGHNLLVALLDQRLLEPIVASFNSVYDYQVTAEGTEVLHSFGIDATGLLRQRRYFARRCQNTHEVNAHLSGSLAEALLEGLLERHWVVRQEGNKPDNSRDRVLMLTEEGKDGLTETFGVKL